MKGPGTFYQLFLNLHEKGAVLFYAHLGRHWIIRVFQWTGRPTGRLGTLLAAYAFTPGKTPNAKSKGSFPSPIQL